MVEITNLNGSDVVKDSRATINTNFSNLKTAVEAGTGIFYNVKTYGATGDGTTDDTTAINAAITAAAVGGTVFFPAGTYRFTSTLAITNDNRVNFTGETRYDTILEKDFNGDGITIEGLCMLFENFTLTNSNKAINGDTGNGIKQMTLGGRIVFRNLIVSYQGGHGIWNTYGNTCSYHDITTQYNDGDGLRFSEGANKNACVVVECNSNHNGGNGIFNNGDSNTFINPIVASNTGYGMDFDTGDNATVIGVFSESNNIAGCIHFGDGAVRNQVIGGDWDSTDIVDDSTGTNSYFRSGTAYGFMYFKDIRLTNIYLNSATRVITSGSGSPEGVLAAPIGSLYLRTDGSTSTTLYVKTSGTGTTGWSAK